MFVILVVKITMVGGWNGNEIFELFFLLEKGKKVKKKSKKQCGYCCETNMCLYKSLIQSKSPGQYVKPLDNILKHCWFSFWHCIITAGFSVRRYLHSKIMSMVPSVAF